MRPFSKPAMRIKKLAKRVLPKSAMQLWPKSADLKIHQTRASKSAMPLFNSVILNNNMTCTVKSGNFVTFFA
jgi:hypothetical protein